MNPIFVNARPKMTKIIAFGIHSDFSCSVKLAMTIDKGKSRKRKLASVLVGEKTGIINPRTIAKDSIRNVKRVLLTLIIIVLKRLLRVQIVKVISNVIESTKKISLKTEKSKFICGINFFQNLISLKIKKS